MGYGNDLKWASKMTAPPRLALLLLCFITVASQAQDTGNTNDNSPAFSNEFLNIGVGARSFGLGRAMVAHVNDVSAGYWNPAGLNYLDSDFELGLMHSDYFGGLANYDYGAFAASLKDESKIALSVIRFAVDNIPDTRFLFDANGVIDYSRVEFFAATDYGFLLSYARELPVLGGINIGGNAKVIHRIAGPFAQSWGFGIDLGAQKTMGKWQFGLFAKDIFSTFNAWSHNPDEIREVYNLTGNTIPTNSIEITLPRVILGVSRTFEFLNTFQLLTALDLDVTFDGKRNTIIRTSQVSVDPHAGLELGFKQKIFVRFGINNLQQLTDFDRSQYWNVQPNLGLGFKIKEFQIDYALTDVGDQSDALFSHVISINVDFNVEK